MYHQSSDRVAASSIMIVSVDERHLCKAAAGARNSVHVDAAEIVRLGRWQLRTASTLLHDQKIGR